MHRRSRARSAAPLVLAAPLLLVELAACAGGPPAQADALSAPAVAVPSAWRDAQPLAFSDLVEGLLPEVEVDGARVPVRLAPASLTELTQALAGPPPLAVRAAVLLGRSGDPAALEALLVRLEQRVLGPQRISDAGDAVAASALSAWGSDPARLRRLVALAVGPSPHPDLEVRVECARTAVRLGSDAPVPYLVRTLLIGTPAWRRGGGSWPPPPNTAWARERAAEVLAWRAGVAPRYSADASFADREAETERLALALLELGVPVTSAP